MKRVKDWKVTMSGRFLGSRVAATPSPPRGRVGGQDHHDSRPPHDGESTTGRGGARGSPCPLPQARSPSRLAARRPLAADAGRRRPTMRGVGWGWLKGVGRGGWRGVLAVFGLTKLYLFWYAMCVTPSCSQKGLWGTHLGIHLEGLFIPIVIFFFWTKL